MELNVETPGEYISAVNEDRVILNNFWKSLKSDWRKWIILQVKNAMLTGKNTIFIANIENKMWKRGRSIMNLWRAVPTNDLKYYNKQYNVLIVKKSLRNIIDYITDVGMTWYIVPEWTNSMVSNKYYSIHASWSF